MRNLILNLIDFVSGFNLNKGLKKVLEMDTWDRSQIEQYQHERFEKLKFYASKSEIYRDCQAWDLKDFPKFSFDFYRTNPEKFRTNFRKIYRVIPTSGSTGTPKEIVVSKEMIQAKRTAHLKLLHWNNIKRSDLEIFIGGDVVSTKKRIYYFLKNQICLTSFDIDRDNARKYINKINQCKPKIIFSYPHALNVLLNYAEVLNLHVYQPKAIYTGAEKLHPETVQLIKHHFPETRLVNEYWSTEGNIGLSCPEGSLHVDEDTVIVEVDNVNEEGVGDLLLTNLYSYDFPIIRYPLGDKIKLSDNFCKCGRKTKVIEKIEGRSGDFFSRPNGRIISFTDMRIAKWTTNAVIIYQMIYISKEDRLVFKYVPKKGGFQIAKDEMKKYFQNHLDIDLTFEETGKIESSQSGKFQPFISV
ncbi:MAG: phenylacetate--CoA ligase family protein [Bacteroidales bacterium]|nr:phenylacetate--CoA ligase family protein [Bacteroidales bacterium]